MAALISNFMAIKFIYLVYLNFFTAANKEENMAQCMKTMAEYCKNTRTEPTSLQCFKEALDSWRLEEIQNIKYLNEFYALFSNNVNIDNVPTPNDYCSTQDDTLGNNYLKCLDDLRVFGEGTTAKAVNNAIYHLKKSNFVTQNEVEGPSTRFIKHYGFQYMAEIQFRIVLYVDEITKPWQFCKEKCYPDGNEFPGWPHVTIMFYNMYPLPFPTN